MKRLLILLALNTALTLTTNAQVGWTLSECQRLFGSQGTEYKGTFGPDFAFDFGSLNVVACFAPGIDSVSEVIYTKRASIKDKLLNEKEVAALLGLNGDGIQWKAEGPNGKPHEERDKDGSLYLYWIGYDKDGH